MEENNNKDLNEGLDTNISNKIDQAVNMEQGLSSIKDSDQFFIQQNYRKMTLEQLCMATQLDPIIINNYVQEYEQSLKEQGISPDNKFNFIVGLNADGTVSYRIEWPDLNTIELMLPLVGQFFHSLNEGKLKISMVSFLKRYSEETGAYTIVNKIFESWVSRSESLKNQPIIEPHNVFQE